MFTTLSIIAHSLIEDLYRTDFSFFLVPTASELMMTNTTSPDKGPRIVAAAVSVIVVQVLVLILRFWSRSLSTRARFWWDDWTVLAALVKYPQDSQSNGRLTYDLR